MLTLTEANDILKNYYLPGVNDLLNSKILLLNRMEKNTEDFEGEIGVIALRKGRNQGVGARAENGTLPTAGSQQYDKATFSMTSQYGRIQITGQVIKATKSDTGSYLRAVDSEVKGITKDLKNDFNRQSFNDGRGDLATVSAVSVAGDVTFTASPVRWIKENMRIDILNSATGAAGSNSTNRLVTSVVVSTGVVTVEGTGNYITLPSNPTVYRNGNYGMEFFGLLDIVSTGNPNKGNFGNITRTNNTWWQANVLANSGVNRPLSLDLMEQLKDEIDINGDGEVSLIVTNHALHRKYGKLLTPDRRFPTADGKPINLDGGYKALMYDEIPVVKDKDAPDNKMFFLDEETFVFFQQTDDLEWMDLDGSILSRVANTDAYEGTLVCYAEIANRDPRNNGRLDDLQQ